MLVTKENQHYFHNLFLNIAVCLSTVILRDVSGDSEKAIISNLWLIHFIELSIYTVFIKPYKFEVSKRKRFQYTLLFFKI